MKLKYRCYRVGGDGKLINPLNIKKVVKFKLRDDYFRILTNDGDSVNCKLVNYSKNSLLKKLLGIPIISLAIVSRGVRKLSGKVTPLEIFLMNKYYNYMVKVLEEKR